MPETSSEILILWEKYSKEKSLSVKHKLILHYIWLVKYVLSQMNLPTNSILNDEDFLNIGILGLHESIERFEIERGLKFESYAIPRIRGSIQDELRRLDWLSRSARKKASDLMQAADELRSKEGREVSSEEIRKKMRVTPEKYQSYLAAAAAAKASMSLYDPQIRFDDEEYDVVEEIPDEDEINYLDKLENEERLDFITNYLKNLAERKRLVMTLYYYENLTFREIGEVISVSESRISQIHSQVVKDLRGKLYEFDNA